MNTKIGVLLLVIGMGLSSCNNNRTYADMKKDQKKAIDRVISEKNLEIIHKYPENGVFKENQFVLLDNGVYLNVIDSGNGNRAVAGETKILMRCSVERMFYAKNDTAKYNLFDNYYSPIEFVYGTARIEMSKYTSKYNTTNGPYYNSPIECYYLSTGVESILEYVGENAEVKLIVPFEEGSIYQSTGNYGAPIYYDRVRFQFY